MIIYFCKGKSAEGSKIHPPPRLGLSMWFVTPFVLLLPESFGHIWNMRSFWYLSFNWRILLKQPQKSFQKSYIHELHWSFYQLLFPILSWISPYQSFYSLLIDNSWVMLFHNKQSNDSRFNNAQFLQKMLFFFRCHEQSDGRTRPKFHQKVERFHCIIHIAFDSFSLK